MSGEKKRYRWRRSPLLIEENLIINSKLTSTTTTTRTEEEKHTKNFRRKWFSQDDADGNDDDDDGDEEGEKSDDKNHRPTETIAEKIDRVLKKINAWTNETSVNNPNPNIHDDIFTNKHVDLYDNIQQQQKPNQFRRRCSSSTNDDLSSLKYDQRPYSMAFINEPLPMSMVNPYRRSFYDKSRKTQAQRQSMYSPLKTNLKSVSSMYGSDFFYPADQDQHEYDNLSSIQKSIQTTCEPFPTIVVDCQRCSRSVDRSSLRDISCQVPSDDEIYQDIHFHTRHTSRSSPVYASPRSSPPPLCAASRYTPSSLSFATKTFTSIVRFGTQSIEIRAIVFVVNVKSKGSFAPIAFASSVNMSITIGTINEYTSSFNQNIDSCHEKTFERYSTFI